MSKIFYLAGRAATVLKHEGIAALLKTTASYLKRNLTSQPSFQESAFPQEPHHMQETHLPQAAGSGMEVHCDILFVNGCHPSIPHPIRYRVHHQREQLEARNLHTGEVFYQDLTIDMVRLARGFVFFRCPHTAMVARFIKRAKQLNKTVFFDIDDLVFDVDATDRIEYVRNMPPAEKAIYDDGVRRMKKTMLLCDSVITTTEHLAAEIGKHAPDVFINRNVVSESMVQLSLAAMEHGRTVPEDGDSRIDAKAAPTTVRVGYLSGSITHNPDFELVLPVLIRIMRENPQTTLVIGGHLDVPESLKEFDGRVEAFPFAPWNELPAIIASLDVNLAPVADTLFNACKSENKWTEAALVKVPTIASRIGAFAHVIRDGETGVLCSDEEEWHDKLGRLVRDASWRREIGENAHAYCMRHCLTMYTGGGIAGHILGKLRPLAVFVLPDVSICGGVYVAMKHAAILQSDGWDVLLVSMGANPRFADCDGALLPVMHYSDAFLSAMDCCVATMWSTLTFLEQHWKIKKNLYLVQNFETEFYAPGTPERFFANRTYSPVMPLTFITISAWCREWLRETFGHDAAYAQNGITTERFRQRKRTFAAGENIIILIEGDCESYHKNVDESFAIADRLDPDTFEIWYMSYHGKPKSHYRIDRFFHKVPIDKTADVYRNSHILLKSSRVESFSYPPLEMMATGGYAVVAPNGGNVEYLRDGENCLFYQPGDIDKGAEAIRRICDDAVLRGRLDEGGRKTVAERDWDRVRGQVIALYNEAANG